MNVYFCPECCRPHDSTQPIDACPCGYDDGAEFFCVMSAWIDQLEEDND